MAYSQDPQTPDLYRITNAKVIGLLAAIVVLGASYLIDIFIINDHSEIIRIKENYNQLMLRIQKIERDDSECIKETENTKNRLTNLNARMERYHEEQHQQELRLKSLEYRFQQ